MYQTKHQRDSARVCMYVDDDFMGKAAATEKAFSSEKVNESLMKEIQKQFNNGIGKTKEATISECLFDLTQDGGYRYLDVSVPGHAGINLQITNSNNTIRVESLLDPSTRLLPKVKGIPEFKEAEFNITGFSLEDVIIKDGILRFVLAELKEPAGIRIS